MRISPIFLCGALLAGCAAHTPLSIAHAHNDYAHPRPLFDALDHGFRSVEADVFLVNGQLLVGHDEKDLSPERSLQSLYLDPLRNRIAANGGSVYRDGGPFWLMIDVKSDAEPTYAALREALIPYQGLLTQWRDNRAKTGAVTIILSGNRATQTIARERDRLVAIDGRLDDLTGQSSPTLIPWISAPWKKTFTWTGKAEMPPDQREALRDLVRQAHARHRMIRFWETPETTTAWQELRRAGVDLINTDDLAGLATFLHSR
jgi:Glycerophosphoryl diester phosphodiesterase family